MATLLLLVQGTFNFWFSVDTYSLMSQANANS